jgi:hypothetical protein
MTRMLCEPLGVVRLGAHMRLSTRRVVQFCGESTNYSTVIGRGPLPGTSRGRLRPRDAASNNVSTHRKRTAQF